MTFWDIEVWGSVAIGVVFIVLVVGPLSRSDRQ